jgi:hypothetical protein
MFGGSLKGTQPTEAVKGPPKSESSAKTYETYTKSDPVTGKVYTGRTSGTRGPLKNIQSRDYDHHMNEQGYGPARLDKSSSNPFAIRGREQQLVDKNGGSTSTGGISGNRINSVSPMNPNGGTYERSAIDEFGSP